MPPTLARTIAPVTTTGTVTTTTGAFSPAANEVLVIIGSTESGDRTFGAISSSPALTWTLRVSSNDASTQHSPIFLWTATVGGVAPGSMTVSVAAGSGTGTRIVCGSGWASAKLAATPATHSVIGSTTCSDTITTTAANSIVVSGVADWNSVAGTVTYRGGATMLALTQLAAYCNYAQYQAAAAAGSQTYGLSAPSGQMAGMVAIELLASATATTSTKSGHGAATGVASGSKAITPGSVYAKSGRGAATGVASGPKAVTGAPVYVKTGGALGVGAASGPKAITSAAVATKTGGGVTAAVGSGPKTIVATLYVKAGGGLGAGVASGPKTFTVHTVVVKTGAAVAAAAGSGPKALAGAATAVKAGGGAAAGVAVGSRVITAASVWAGAASAAAGVWSNVAGAVGSTAGDYASWTASGTPGDAATLDLSAFGAGSIPQGAIVSSVDVTVRHRESSTTAMATVTAQLFIGATPVGAVATLTKRNVDGDDVFTIIGGITYADLANLHVRLIATGT